jgi:hypothetical protein
MMSGIQMVFVLVMIFSVRILLPIGVISGVGTLLRKLQAAA